MSRLTVLPMMLIAACVLGCGDKSPPATPATTPTPESTTYAAKILGALDRAAIEKTRADMRAISTALGAYGSQVGEEPNAPDFASLIPLLAPTFIRRVPDHDAWGGQFHFERTADGYQLTAPGADGAVGTGDDVVLTDGAFTKLPEGYRAL